MAANVVAEEARERETFRYDSSLINQVFPNPDDAPIFPSELTPDPSLTAFAELGVHRLNACRAFVSLFDRQHQYIVAEATPTTPLSPGSSAAQQPSGRDGLEAQLLLWGTSLPRSSSICDHVLTSLAPGVAPERIKCGQEPYPELPVTVIGDLENHPFMESRAAFPCWPPYKFYAGVPLRTPKGIDIGVFSVLDMDGRKGEDPNTRPIMQDISRTIMGYLETRRFRDGQRRADRMVKGVGSFVQGKSTTSGWQVAPCADEPEGRVDANGGDVENDPTTQPSTSKDKKSHVNDVSTKSATHIFSKAAKIIRESIEADGVLFLDAGIFSFGGRATVGGISGTPDAERRASATSMHYAAGTLNNCSCCKVLGFSTSYSSSIDGHDQEQCYKQLPEHVLGEYLKKYSRGTIITLNELDTPKDTTAVSDEGMQSILDTSRHVSGLHLDLQKTKPSESIQTEYDMEDFVRDLLPGARNIAFFPLWDPQKRRWYAGGFAYTKKASRVLSVEGELSYLLAFGTVIMAEVFRIDSKVVEQSKMDVLSSISHELRSPLHGIILGAELLHDTALDAFQGDLLHSMETCSRTLLDTVDHLLDWSGVNNFLSPAPVPQDNGDVEERGLRSGKMATIESGMMSIVSRVSVDLIVEEVVESVYAGRIFQLRTLGSNGAQNGNPAGSDAMQPNELVDCLAAQKESDISMICVDIEPNASWEFYAQPGALRRVVMNLVGNSLKFTTKGFVKVSLDQPRISPALGEQEGTYVRLTVTDSGCGIGKSYLENDVFTPFIQEDGLKPGMGLGLSFVERIVTALKGSISIQSVVDKGTSVSVTLPLPAVVPETAIPRLQNPGHEFESQRNDLRGLRVLLLGFRDTPSVDSDDGVFGTNVVEREGIANICRDWLQMQVVDPSQSNTFVPDLLLCDETYLHLNSHIHTQRNASSPPAVVICRNAVSARDLAENKIFKRRPNDQLWEFSAQPVGPRKLAKVLALTFKRWTTFQATLNPMTLSATQTPEDEDGPRAANITTTTTPDQNSSADGTPESIMLNLFQDLSLPERVRRSTPLTATYPDANVSDIDSNQPGTSFLLVDDNPINLKILTTYMKKLRLPYRTAINGQQAVDLFREGNGLYKCVFMDISMPVMDGFEATRHIRSTEMEQSLHRCTIFALTGLASADAQQEAFTSGIDLFLTKPVKLAELSQILLARFGTIGD